VTQSSINVPHNLNMPLGLNPIVLDNVPADATSTMSITFAIDRQDRLRTILGALDAGNTVASALLATPAVGYSQVVASVFMAVFGTDKTLYPFVWQGQIDQVDVADGTSIQPHYLVLIAPNSGSDAGLGQLVMTKLSYDKANAMLLYEGKALQDRSYLVLQ